MGVESYASNIKIEILKNQTNKETYYTKKCIEEIRKYLLDHEEDDIGIIMEVVEDKSGNFLAIVEHDERLPYVNLTPGLTDLCEIAKRNHCRIVGQVYCLGDSCDLEEMDMTHVDEHGIISCMAQDALATHVLLARADKKLTDKKKLKNKIKKSISK